MKIFNQNKQTEEPETKSSGIPDFVLKYSADNPQVYDEDEEYTEDDLDEDDPGEETADAKPKKKRRRSARQDRSDLQILLVILVQFLLLGVLWIKNYNAFLNYLYVLGPLVLITGVLGNFAYQRNADMRLFKCAAILTSAGIALQFIIEELYYTESVYVIWKYAVALGVSLVFLVFYSLFRKFLNTKFTVYLMLLICPVIYLVLYFFGYDPNGSGTYAWIRIGSYTTQLTDFTKVAAILFYASLFSSGYRENGRQILILSTIFFVLNGIGSVMINELGSFMILFVLHLALLFIFMPHSKAKRWYLITLFAVCASAVVFSYVAYKLLLPAYNAGTLSGLGAKMWPIVQKVYQRFSITANIQSDPYGAGYQLLQGKKAMWMAGWFGNTVNFTAIPVPESDMAFVVFANLFGLPAAFYLITLYARIAIYGGNLARRLYEKDPQDAVVVFGVAAILWLQAMIVILGSCNVIPFTGLPIPFLSRGGTYQMIVFCLTAVLIRMSERKEESNE